MVKYSGAGATVEVDTDGTPTWVLVGCTVNITPPPQVRNDVDASCQADLYASPIPGQEQISQFQFVEPMDPASSSLDALYTAGTSHDWRVTFTRGVNTLVMTFSGYISGFTPGTAGANDLVQRTVTVTRDGPIAWT